MQEEWKESTESKQTLPASQTREGEGGKQSSPRRDLVQGGQVWKIHSNTHVLLFYRNPNQRRKPFLVIATAHRRNIHALSSLVLEICEMLQKPLPVRFNRSQQAFSITKVIYHMSLWQAGSTKSPNTNNTEIFFRCRTRTAYISFSGRFSIPKPSIIGPSARGALLKTLPRTREKTFSCGWRRKSMLVFSCSRKPRHRLHKKRRILS